MSQLLAMIVHFDIPRVGYAAQNIVYLILWYARPMSHAIRRSIQTCSCTCSRFRRRPIRRRVGFAYHHGYSCGCGCGCGCVCCRVKLLQMKQEKGRSVSIYIVHLYQKQICSLPWAKTEHTRRCTHPSNVQSNGQPINYPRCATEMKPAPAWQGL